MRVICATCHHERLYHVPSIHLPSGRAYCVRPDCLCMAFTESANACGLCGVAVEDHPCWHFARNVSDCQLALAEHPNPFLDREAISVLARIDQAPDLPRECGHDHRGGPCDCYSDIHQPGLD